MARIALLIITIIFCSVAYGMENLFYMLRSLNKTTDSEIVLHDLRTYPKLIHILVSQAYTVDENGDLSGKINSGILEYARTQGIKFMPLVTNVGFDAEKIHKFLADSAAQRKAIAAIITECKNNQYYGVQFDFEGARVADKDALTQFYQTAAKELHQNGFVISVAIVPRLSDVPQGDFWRVRFQVLSGVYDYKKIGESVDFVTLMAYDQHWGDMPPGPVAGIDWVEALVIYALHYIPANKISLGIPTYSDFWYTGSPQSDPRAVRLVMDQISYQTVQRIIKRYDVILHWDDSQKIPYTIFQRNWLFAYIYGENADSFRAKVELAKKYNLRGISVWRMGMEDPDIWTKL